MKYEWEERTHKSGVDIFYCRQIFLWVVPITIFDTFWLVCNGKSECLDVAGDWVAPIPHNRLKVFKSKKVAMRFAEGLHE